MMQPVKEQLHEYTITWLIYQSNGVSVNTRGSLNPTSYQMHHGPEHSARHKTKKKRSSRQIKPQNGERLNARGPRLQARVPPPPADRGGMGLHRRGGGAAVAAGCREAQGSPPGARP